MKGLKKLPLAIAISSVMAATAQAELKALEDEAMSEMTGQSGITIEMEMQAEVGAVTYTDEGSIRLEGITLDNNGGALNQTINIDMLEKSDLAAGPGAATKAAGDIIKVGISNMEMDVEVDAIRTGDASAASLGQLNIEDIAMNGTDMYVYALDGKKGIGVDAIINQSIGRVSFTDIDPNAANGAEDGGTVALNDIKISTLDMTGTEVTVIDGAENPYGTFDAVKVTMPGINNGSISVGGIQVGSATDDTYDQFNQTIGAVELNGLNLAGTDMYVYAPDTGSGIRVTQQMNVTLGEVTYVAGVLDADTADKTVTALTAKKAQVDGLIGTLDPVADAAQIAQLTAASNDLGNKIAVADKVYYKSGELGGTGRTGDGVGSVTLSNVSLTSDISTIAIDVDASNHLVIDAPMTNANITVGAINVGDGNLGGLAITGLNMTTNSISVYAH
ncbi:DUF6160 family protein [Kistimonas asteriae]|uniref:DUF6160 family protein n=1 Tax=Kistimonas asteriae TaxID=517724 RepID=UPI001BA97F61|nr:DUF6160 family protein [Kistimonas asteriae]